MGLTPVRRGIEDVAHQLLAPFLEGCTAAGWTLISWDAEQAICATFERAGISILIELEERNDRLDCYTRTERFNVCARRLLENEPMSESDRHLVDTVVAVVRSREASLPGGARPRAERGTLVREVVVDRLLMPEGRNHYYINPYVGCMIGCSFCYVIDRADFSRRLEGLPQLPWGRYLDVKVNAAEVLRREVRAAGRGTVRMSPILTDPYQSAERRYRITRQCLEVLLDSELAPVILTRAPRVLDDVALLERFRRALVGFSIPTDADEYRQIFEPAADPIAERLAALRALHEAGIRTFAVIQPVLPMNVERLVAEIAPYVCAVRLDRMYVGERVRHLYERHGLQQFATEEFADQTIRELAAGFSARGVEVDSLDDLEHLLPP